MWRSAVQLCAGLLQRLARVMGSPTQPQGCGGESGGNRALYVAQRHSIARFAEHGGLAQLARAPALQAGGQRFESVILHRSPLMGSLTQPQGCGGESGGNRALYAAQRHLIARFAEREEIFDVLNELEV